MNGNMLKNDYNNLKKNTPADVLQAYFVLCLYNLLERIWNFIKNSQITLFHQQSMHYDIWSETSQFALLHTSQKTKCLENQDNGLSL